MAIINEIRDLRSILERLEQTADDLNDQSRPAFQFLCDADKGPLAACSRELDSLEGTLSGMVGSKRKAVLQTLGWGVSEQDIQASLDKIGRCKSSLTLALSANQMSMLRSLMSSTEELSQGMTASIGTLNELSYTITRSQTDEEFRAILHWLSPLDASESHELAQGMRLEATCKWIEECKEYLVWSESTLQRLLWLTASPGCGKTVLFGSVVDHLTEVVANDYSKSQLLAYFYCDFRNADAQTLRHIFGSLLSQLIAVTRACPDAVFTAYRDDRRAQNTAPKLKMIRQCIVDICKEYRVFILLDGLDESNHKIELADSLMDLLQDTPNTRVLVTSRSDVELEDILTDAERINFSHHANEVAGDIQTYITNRLQTDRRLSALTKNIHKDVATSLNAKSGGMFRWVQCQLDAISSMKTARAIKGALGGLPEGLYDTYGRILMNVEDHDKDLFTKILLWLSFSVLPLKLGELADAIAIELGSNGIDDDSRLTNPSDILSIGGSLVTVSGNGSLRLAHLSVRDYLTSKDILQQPLLARFALDKDQSHKALAQSCLTYLSFKEFAAGPANSAKAYQSRLHKYPFLSYASVGFSYHIRETTLDDELRQMISSFFGKDGRGRLLSWIQILIADRDFTNWNYQPGDGAPIYYAASFGLTDVVRILISEGVNLDAPGGRFNGTALHAAAYRCHYDIVKLLLEAGADPNVEDITGYTPLEFAQTMRDEESLKIFEEYAKVKAKKLEIVGEPEDIRGEGDSAPDVKHTSN
ncbi:Vegetative incompatibility HET-E-1-like protein [Cladobotryum mycophilum]|uniref:Vegetative incompatibility HET-E-1-like protein n=1 Tax=Cladobotryum mycophilum TaxID=491253 RepID=A0ABR0T3V7_9HYPO